jgi:hypothetical protein
MCFVITGLAFEAPMGLQRKLQRRKGDCNEFNAKAGTTTECIV